jgi:hypothetical protein
MGLDVTLNGTRQEIADAAANARALADIAAAQIKQGDLHYLQPKCFVRRQS